MAQLLLDTPALLIDLDLLDANIATLFAALRPTGVRVRPHLKTAKSPHVAQLLLAAGAGGFCVSKLAEAEIFCAAGFDDLLITSELAGTPKLTRLAGLHARHPRVRVVVDSLVGAQALNAALSDLAPLEVLIELDVGQQRCGVGPGEPALALAHELAMFPNLRLVGLQGYEGHLQHLADPVQKQAHVTAALSQLVDTAALLRAAGYTIETVTTAGTGTCQIAATIPGVTEVQPGSFVFLDAAYRAALGPACAYHHALVVLATVISRPTPQRAVVDAGLKALSTDMGNPQPHNLPGVRYRPGGDEHGILEWDAESTVTLQVGDQIELIPSHIDTTVNLHDTYYVQRDNTLVATWPIAARGRIQ